MVIHEMLDTVGDCLKSAGLALMREYPNSKIKRHTRPVFVLGVRALKMSDGAFEDYLGRRYDDAAGTIRDYYGKSAEAELSMDIFAPVKTDSAGSEELEEAFAVAVNALLGCRDKSLCLSELQRGKLGFDTTAGMYHCSVTLCFKLFLTAVASEDGGELLDFRLGDITINV